MTLEQRRRNWEGGIDAARELARLCAASERRDESHYSFVLAQRGVNKMCGFMSSGEKLSGWKSDTFQCFRIQRCVERRGGVNAGGNTHFYL